VAGRRIGRVLPESGRDDWSADLVPLGDLLARRLRWHAVARFARAADRRLLSGPHGVRAHPVAWSVAAAEVGAAVLVSGLVVRERTPLWLIGPLGALVAGAGFLWVVYAANRWLGLARVEPGRPDLRALGLGAAVGLDLAFTFRDPLWALLGLGSSVPGLGLVYLVMLVGAVLGAGLTWLVRRLSPRRWPVAARP
jgi:hypothetical protein